MCRRFTHLHSNTRTSPTRHCPAARTARYQPQRLVHRRHRPLHHLIAVVLLAPHPPGVSSSSRLVFLTSRAHHASSSPRLVFIALVLAGASSSSRLVLTTPRPHRASSSSRSSSPRASSSSRLDLTAPHPHRAWSLSRFVLTAPLVLAALRPQRVSS
jgi:hypothetical protein